MTVSSNVKPLDWSNIDVSSFDNIQYDAPSMIGSVASEGFAVGLSSVNPDFSEVEEAIDMNIVKVASNHNWNLPAKCPRCGADLIINPSGFPECPNEKCIAKLEQLCEWCKRLI